VNVNVNTKAHRPAEELYVELQPRLWRILTTNLQISEALLEDACQTAWIVLLIFRASIEPGSELGWLSTTATRYALKLQRAQLEVEPLDELAQLVELARYRPLDPGPGHAIETLERLAEIRELPARQRRLVWLQGLGYEYVEIAAATGESRRTVERQLLRAHKRLADRSRKG
jgi:RNA polymerase sigma factor (sigma-70 family)